MDNTNTFYGIVAGAAIGAIFGVLYAPDKGVKTRRKISKKVKETKEEIEGQALSLKNQVSDTISLKKETLDEKVENIVSDVSYQTEEIIETLESKLNTLKQKNRKLQKTS